jgi:hypothetical protein
MDSDRKYRQAGYMDSGRAGGNGHSREERPRGGGQRLPLDVTGPRLPRLVQTVVAGRCFNCSTMLPENTDYKAQCPRCATALHCCKQCSNFEPSTRFQCIKPILVRIAAKDQTNDCTFFRPRVTVARDAAPAAAAASPARPAVSLNTPGPRNQDDARAAFDSLFKK